MAVSLWRSLPWTNETLAMESFHGLKMNRYWNGWIKTNNNPERKPISTELRAGWVAFGVFSQLFKNFSEFEKSLSSTAPTHFGQDYVPNPLGPYFYGALFFVALSAHKIMTEYEWNKPPELGYDLGGALARSKTREPYIPSRFDNVVEVAWQVTPYLMVITNIALTAFEIRNGDNKAWIKLFVTGVTLIDISSWKPEGFSWYLTVFARYPIEAAALFYSDNWERFYILLGWVGTEPVIPYMNKLVECIKKSQERSDEWDDYLQPGSRAGPDIRVIQDKDGRVINIQRKTIALDDQSPFGTANPSQHP
jgi:hypothetical protein